PRPAPQLALDERRPEVRGAVHARPVAYGPLADGAAEAVGDAHEPVRHEPAVRAAGGVQRRVGGAERAERGGAPSSPCTTSVTTAAAVCPAGETWGSETNLRPYRSAAVTCLAILTLPSRAVVRVPPRPARGRWRPGRAGRPPPRRR